jgi:hypothetical protein
MSQRERHILERAIHSIAEQAANTNGIVEEAIQAGLPADHPVTVATKMLRQELLQVKADLERELGKLWLTCRDCGMDVHWVQGIAVSDPGHWAHARPAPHGEPAV